VRPTTVVRLKRAGSRRPVAQRSAGQWPAHVGEDTDQGLDCGTGSRVEVTMDPGVRPELFSCCGARRSAVVVETRRLELLTLSLQRRCSAD
jgi:hypothetical protein